MKLISLATLAAILLTGCSFAGHFELDIEAVAKDGSE